MPEKDLLEEIALYEKLIMFSTIKNRELLKIYLTPLFRMFIMSASGSIQILFALDLGANIFQINLITTISSAMQILLQVPFGILSDRFGRKPMMIRMSLLQVGSTLVRVFATDPTHLIYASVIGGFAGGEFFPIMQSMIGDITEFHQRQEAMSLLYLFSSIGMLSSPVVFSFLLTLPQIGLRNVFQIIAVAQTVFILYVATQLKETKRRVSGREKLHYRLHVTNLLRKKSFILIALVGLLVWFFRQIMITYIRIFARVDLNLSDAEVASFDVFSNGATFLIRLVSATLLTRAPFRPAIISFMALAGITGVMTSFATSYVFVAVIFFLLGISYGATRIMQNVLIANISTQENRGIANSVNQLFQSVASFSRIFTSPIVDSYGFHPIFLLAATAAFIAAIIPILQKETFEYRSIPNTSKG